MATRDRFKIELRGVSDAIRELRSLGNKIARHEVRVAVSAAAGEFKKEAQKRAPQETGLLRRSMGVRVGVSRDATRVWARIGARRGFKRPVAQTKRGRLRTISDRRAASMPEVRYRNPTRYLHLVEQGTKRGVRAQKFMEKASITRMRAAEQKAISKLRSAVARHRARTTARAS